MNFDYQNPYTSTRLPVFARNVVSTSHPLAAQAGLRMLWQGGNAVDAALALGVDVRSGVRSRRGPVDPDPEAHPGVALPRPHDQMQIPRLEPEGQASARRRRIACPVSPQNRASRLCPKACGSRDQLPALTGFWLNHDGRSRQPDGDGFRAEGGI